MAVFYKCRMYAHFNTLIACLSYSQQFKGVTEFLSVRNVRFGIRYALPVTFSKGTFTIKRKGLLKCSAYMPVVSVYIAEG
jgi:hypothetical protein